MSPFLTADVLAAAAVLCLCSPFLLWGAWLVQERRRDRLVRDARLADRRARVLAEREAELSRWVGCRDREAA